MVLLDGDRIQTPWYAFNTFSPLSFLLSFIKIWQVYHGTTASKTLGLLAHPTQSTLNVPLPPLVELGFFDMLFRDAFKEHLATTDKAKLCPYVDLIIGILKNI